MQDKRNINTLLYIKKQIPLYTTLKVPTSCRAQRSINENAKVLSIIIYSDATTCDILGKKSEHPVFLTLGNIPSWRRNKPDAKALLAYLPKINQNDQKNAALAKLQLFHLSIYSH